MATKEQRQKAIEKLVRENKISNFFYGINLKIKEKNPRDNDIEN